jgi:hypothetical protein
MPVLFLTLPPATTPLERFVRILDGLCAAIAARGAGGVLTMPLLFLLWGRLRRMAGRATKAAARLATGVPPAVARRRPARPRPPRPPTLRLPRGFAWVVPLVPGAAAYGCQLQGLLADPAMAPLAAEPSMRRLLNPLCQMLGVPARASRPPRRPATIAQDQPASCRPRPGEGRQTLAPPLQAPAPAAPGPRTISTTTPPRTAGTAPGGDVAARASRPRRPP